MNCFVLVIGPPYPNGRAKYLKLFRVVYNAKSSAKHQVSKADLKVFKCLLIVFGTYLFTKIPEVIIITQHLHLIHWSYSNTSLAIDMFPLNSALDAFIIGLFNPEFKDHFKKVICCGLKSGDTTVAINVNANRGAAKTVVISHA